MAKTLAFPQLSETVVKICRNSENEFIRSTPDWLKDFFELDSAIDDEREWVLSKVETIKKNISAVSDPRHINQIFWTDQARLVEAYSYITFWRGSELLKSSIRGLNAGNTLAPSIIARSLLELSSMFLTVAAEASKTFREIEFPQNTVVASQWLEDRMLKAIWGTRMAEQPEYLKQTNVLTTIQKLSKLPQATELLPHYEFLCEVAHPNVIGNLRFWSHIDRENPDGSETVALARRARGDNADRILDQCLWALGWSAFSIRSSFGQIESGIKILSSKL